MKLRLFTKEIAAHKDAILMGVVSDPDIRKMLYKYDLSDELISEIVMGVQDYFISSLVHQELLGSCPEGRKFLDKVKVKELPISDLFLFCIHIREAVTKEILNDPLIMSTLTKESSLLDIIEDILHEINTIFDANISGTLSYYYEILTSLVSEYNKAVDASNIVSKTDPKGIITYVNDEFCRISGYTAKELIGKPHSIVRHPNSPKALFIGMWNTIGNGQIWNGIIENLRKTGESYFVDATIVPILDTDGKILEFIGIRHDVTALIAHQKEMDKMRELLLNKSVTKAFSIQYQEVANAIPLPAFMVDSSDKIIVANPLFWSLFQTPQGSVIAQKLKEKERTFGSLLLESPECVTDCLVISWRELAMSFDEGQCISICFIDEIGSQYDVKISELKEGENKVFLCVMRPKQ